MVEGEFQSSVPQGFELAHNTLVLLFGKPSSENTLEQTDYNKLMDSKIEEEINENKEAIKLFESQIERSQFLIDTARWRSGVIKDLASNPVEFEKDYQASILRILQTVKDPKQREAELAAMEVLRTEILGIEKSPQAEKILAVMQRTLEQETKALLEKASTDLERQQITEAQNALQALLQIKPNTRETEEQMRIAEAQASINDTTQKIKLRQKKLKLLNYLKDNPTQRENIYKAFARLFIIQNLFRQKDIPYKICINFPSLLSQILTPPEIQELITQFKDVPEGQQKNELILKFATYISEIENLIKFSKLLEETPQQPLTTSN